MSSRVVVRGRDDLCTFFGAFLPVLSRDLQGRRRVGNGETTVALAVARLGGVRVEDAMLIEQNAEGRIHRITPHVRPWLGLTVSVFVLGPKLMRHPGLIRREAVRLDDRPGQRAGDPVHCGHPAEDLGLVPASAFVQRDVGHGGGEQVGDRPDVGQPVG